MLTINRRTSSDFTYERKNTMRKAVFLTCVAMLFISTAEHARGECTKHSLQIEEFCNHSLIDLDNNRSVENTYKRCVASQAFPMVMNQ